MTMRARDLTRRSQTAEGYFIAGSYQKLCDAVGKSKETKVFYGEGFGSRDLVKLYEVLQSNSTLNDLILKDCGTDEQQMKGLFDAIEGSDTLHSFKFNAPPIQDAKGAVLLSYLKGNRTVETLNLHGNQLDRLAIRSICSGLEANTTLTQLNLGSNQLRKDGCEHIGNALKINTTLRVLDLSQTEIDEQGAKQIAQGLAANHGLDYLRLSMNVLIKNEGLKHICAALAMNTSLQTLLMRYTRLSSKGMAHVAECLRLNRSLTLLDLLFNGISDEGVETLVEALKLNRSIMYIRVSDKKATPQTLETLSNALKLNRQLREQAFLDTSQNQDNAIWRRGKLMVVGEGKSGKSCTMRSLLGMRFEPEWKSTIGVEVREAQTFPKRGWRVIGAREYARTLIEHQAVGNWEQDILQRERKSSTAAKKAKAKVKAKQKSKMPVRKASRPLSLGKSRKIALPKVAGAAMFNYNEESFLDAQRGMDGLRISTWDFGGQRVFNTLHHLFLTNFGVCLLVFNLSTYLFNAVSSTEKLKFWLNSVKLHAADAPLILVGTFAGNLQQGKLNKINGSIKSLLTSLEYDLHQFRRGASNLLFHPIENETRKGVAELQMKINKALQVVEHLHIDVPVAWTLILDSMRRTNKNWITRVQVDEIGKDYGIVQAKEINEMLKLFHELGLLLYLTGTETLQTLVTLHAQWVITSVAKIVHDPKLHTTNDSRLAEIGLEKDMKLFQNSGVLSRDLLEYFWDKTQVDFLLELTQNLLLLSTFAFQSREEGFLVPAMIQVPSYIKLEDFEGATFAFNFSFLAEGVFERLVCLSINYVSNLKSLPSPVLKQDSCNMYFDVDKQVDVARVGSRIVVSTKLMAYALKMLVIFQSWMKRINTEAMGGMLNWEMEVKDESFVPLSEAKENPNSKWSNEAQAHISAASLDMEGAFGQTF